MRIFFFTGTYQKSKIKSKNNNKKIHMNYKKISYMYICNFVAILSYFIFDFWHVSGQKIYFLYICNFATIISDFIEIHMNYFFYRDIPKLKSERIITK
jgi:hypothetical protein